MSVCLQLFSHHPHWSEVLPLQDVCILFPIFAVRLAYSHDKCSYTLCTVQIFSLGNYVIRNSLLQDKRPSHKVQLVQLEISVFRFFYTHSILLVDPISCISNFKTRLKGNHFDSYEVIMTSDRWFNFNSWVFYSLGPIKIKQRWQKCINSGGGYIGNK